ncbi:MAG: TetR family transcriptional regulator [Deltaproteobacteria bacterium]|nr:MAG: TetR family transcriptional regulator [Deltaproteobacteria bacterium]
MREVETVRDLRRGQILRAARRIVAERGVGALTFGTLESELAFTRGVITYHFANKDEIVYALLDDAIAEIHEAMMTSVHAGSTLVEKLEAAVGGMVRGFLAKPEAARVLLSFWGRLPDDPRAAAKNAALYARWREHSASLVRHGQETGEIHADCDVAAVAAHMVGTVIGVVTQAFFEADAVDPEAIVREAVRGLAAGLAPRG